MSTARIPSNLYKTSSPLALTDATHSPKSDMSSSQHLNNIFSAVRRQIEQWGDQAKWKIDLVLLENADGTTPQPESPAPNLGSTPSRSVARSPFTSENGPRSTPPHMSSGGYSPSIGRSAFQPPHPVHYPLPHMPQHVGPRTFGPPMHDPNYAISKEANYPMRDRFFLSDSDINKLHHLDDAKQKLHECLERIRLLENVTASQSEQLYYSSRGMNDKNTTLAIDTMRKIYLMNEHEQALRHSVETKMFQKDIRILANKLQNAYAKIRLIESADISTKSNDVDRETLLRDRKTLLRKIRLSEMRSAAKDVELDMLAHDYQKLLYNRDTPELRSMPLQGRPTGASTRRNGNQFLLQQGYSPSPKLEPSIQKQPSGLESLGIVADQMLIDMEDKSKNKPKKPVAIKKPPSEAPSTFKPGPSRRTGAGPNLRDEKRSQRSIDSATALLSMQPTMNFPQQDSNQSNSQKVDIGPNAVDQVSSIWERRRSQSVYTKWTPEEDDMLKASADRHGPGAWEAIAKDIPGRNYQQCRQRWHRLADHGKRDRPDMDASHSPAINNLLTQQQQPSLGSPSPPRSAALDDEPHTPPHQVQYEAAHELPRKPYEPFPALQEKHHPRYHPPTVNSSESLLQPQTTPTSMYRPPSPVSTPKKRKIERVP